jgi:hypothetical protein
MRTEGALFPGFALLLLAAWGATYGLQGRAAAESARWLSRIAATGLVIFSGALTVAVLSDQRFDVFGIAVSISSPHKPLTGALVCALLWLASTRQGRGAFAVRNASLFYAAMAVLMWLMSLGPEARLSGTQLLYSPPYSWLLEIPAAGSLRVPARFWMLGVMSLAVLSAYPFASRILRTRLAALVLLLAILAEGWTSVAAASFRRRVPLAPPAGDGPVLVLPLGTVADDIEAQFHAVRDGYRIVNGYSGYQPPHYMPLSNALERREAGALSALRRGRPLYISVAADGADGWRPWLISSVDDEQYVTEAAGRVLYKLPALPRTAPPRMRRLPLTVASASCNESDAVRIHDGAVASRWECGPARPGQHIVVDVGSVFEVSGVGHTLGPFSADAPRVLRIESSIDGMDWQTVWSGSTGAEAVRAALEEPARVELVLPFAPVRARYLRLTQTGDATIWYWSIAELTVFSSS